MDKFLLVLMVFVVIFMIIVILLQKSEGGGLGVGTGTAGGLMTARGSANLLTKLTGVLAAIFMVICLVMAFLHAHKKAESPVLNLLQQPAADLPKPAALGQQPAAQQPPANTNPVDQKPTPQKPTQ
jgi:preprotein translocase subunit SecG